MCGATHRLSNPLPRNFFSAVGIDNRSTEIPTALFFRARAFVIPTVALQVTMPPDKTHKKRKRISDRHERPTKKPALELQTLPPLAASLIEDQSELAPVIGK